MNVAVFGASKGLGLYLAEGLADKGFLVHGFSRTKPKSPSVIHHNCDVTVDYSINKALKDAGVEFDLIIYCCCLWQEHESMTAAQLQEFIHTGPLGFYQVIEMLNNLQFIKPNANIVSIGSIAANHVDQSSHPAYAISKKLQEILVKRLQANYHLGLKITNLKLGTMGQSFVKVQEVLAVIELIISLGQSSMLSGITLTSTADAVA
ncbi:SDR family NAD(P)-dependent oxidoreductase [Moraxella cuniculi]|uniref:2,3-dihydroxybenzoate-2,3-dehydrogenase n=1 Tax=Moraxella cuniculi TaxID=34061 RepID=A0A448GTX0_9GAMM|nr:SDR family oxidoreductase [Moraxella cuniculi]VEG12168.1 2,3-dihydroxybenzoate-2,3-dehydrogenase [Moraxella cuniculi]